MFGHADAVDALLSRGADPIALSSRGKTPIHFAISENRIGVLRVFLAYNVRITLSKRVDYMAIREAFSKNTNVAVQMLEAIRHTVTENDEVTSLNYFAVLGDVARASQAFARAKESSSEGLADCKTLFSWAIVQGMTPLVKAMINQDIGYVHRFIPHSHVDAHYPLAHACYAGPLDIVRELLSQGADLEAFIPKEGPPALHWAAMSGNAKVVLALLERGADPESLYSDWYAATRT